MHAVDTHVPPLHDQRHQHRHPLHPHANGCHPVPDAAPFLIAGSQSGVPYPVEPVSILFDESMATLAPPSSPGRESMHTPNTAPSFDPALHTDMSFPPTNSFAQTPNYGLSPGSFYDNGQNLSPAHSVEHLSSEGGYPSDPNHQDPSTYTTPSFSAQVLDDFTGLTFADSGPACAFPSYPGGPDMTMLTSSSLNTYNAQPTPFFNSAALEPHHQLMSPMASHASSPVMGDDGSALLPTTQRNGMLSKSPGRMAQVQFSKSAAQTQSPALTNSPGNVPLTNPQPLAPPFTSPIVRIENYSREDSPLQSDNGRPASFDSRQSGNHLSPYPQDDSSDNEQGQCENVCIPPTARTHERNEDGSWATKGGSSQVGLSPEDRQAIGNAYIPSIDDVASQWTKDSKKLEVHEWLTRSEMGSDADDVEPSNHFLKPIAGRRRAKSTNDVQRRGPVGVIGLGVRTDFDHIDDSNIPGPGIYIDERSDYEDEEDDDDSVEPESPPAAIDYQAETSYFPDFQDPVVDSQDNVRPWFDPPSQSPDSSARYQPPTSNAAMMRFLYRAKDLESASLAATVGSRRLSESDLGSIRAAPGITRSIEPDSKKPKERQRRPSFLDNILPKRAPSNLLKRKSSVPVQSSEVMSQDRSKDPLMEKPKRIGSWGRPKSPRVDTSLSNHSKDTGPLSSTGLSTTSGPWFRAPRNVMKRSRSRSDLGRSPGLAELMTQHGGPPMPMLASPLAETEATRPFVQASPVGNIEDDDVEPVTMDLEVRRDAIIPSYEGFRQHARQLNPRLDDFMVERITQEQMRRYKRLLEFRIKHLNAVKNHDCCSGKFCTDLGGEAKQIAPRAGNKDSDAPFVGFQIIVPGSSDDDGESGSEGSVIPAQFPPGVPLPPVKRLPAEFECPLCFKVKRFYKPSDWTKHVHEDVQPFTCTFPNCGEPKSFKRKADWVRHENERHRQLENWTCQLGDCNHTCYRKDNFVQHLVREHKIAEPRQRTGRAGNHDTAASVVQDDVWTIVENCRRDTVKQPKDEPCRFCGNICNSWKKLTVHLAKHMEQISIPILALVDQKQIHADSVISPVMEMPDHRKLAVTPNQPSIDNNPSRYHPNPTYAPGINSTSFRSQDVWPVAAANVMHTYPPPQAIMYKAPQSVQTSGNPTYVAGGDLQYSSQTYPGLQAPPKLRNGYTNRLPMPSHGYHPGIMQNSAGQYGTNLMSSFHQQQAMYTDSPVDTTAFPPYYPQESQNFTNPVPDMNYDTTNGLQFPLLNAYPDIPYMTAQEDYNYQNP